MRLFPAWFLLAAALRLPLLCQNWDVGSRLAETVSAETEGKLTLSVESRGRYELRGGQAFGRDPDADAGLFRSRLGLSFTPVSWLTLSGAVQDSRAPWFGNGAPASLRDRADLHEAYVELFPGRATGFGATAGRMLVNYGESRLIRSGRWGNVSQSFDHARVYYRTPAARIEFLFLSPVKVRSDEFNRPVLGERVWGTYNTFLSLFRKTVGEAYILRHQQNRPAGFSGGSSAAAADRLGVTTFGGRWTGPLKDEMKFSLEGALQTGYVGPAKHRAAAWFSSVNRRWTMARMPLDLSAEYKYASGTADPRDPSRSSTFDQLFAGNHDKFGHQDLFGWRNIHHARWLATLGLTRAIALNLMYGSTWLASARDALYNSAGKAVARSLSGTAGRHAGQEADVFFTWKYNHFTFGSGYGYFFKGEFIRNTTPGVNPTYAYVFHTYSF